jgi:hypothetical protein
MSGADLPVRDQRLRDRRKHLPDGVAMLLPVRRRAGPAIDNFLFGLHKQRSIASGAASRVSILPFDRLASVRTITLSVLFAFVNFDDKLPMNSRFNLGLRPATASSNSLFTAKQTESTEMRSLFPKVSPSGRCLRPLTLFILHSLRAS